MIKKGKVVEIKFSGPEKVGCRVEYPASKTVSAMMPLAAGNSDLELGHHVLVAYWSQMEGIALAIIREVE